MAAIDRSDLAWANWITVEATSSAQKSAAMRTESLRIGVFTTASPPGSASGSGAMTGSAATPTGSSGTGRRAWSEMRSRRDMIIQLASREEPPSDMKGVVRPVSGMTRVTPPMTMNSWNATEKVRPMASSLPKPSRTPRAVRMPRSTKSR